MPVYEYQCEDCGHRIEQLQKISDPPLTVCPECQGRLKKLISAPSFQFKGSGWYVTDYAKKGSRPEGTEASGSSTGESAKDSASADKSETKSETAGGTKSEPAPAKAESKGDGGSP